MSNQDGCAKRRLQAEVGQPVPPVGGARLPVLSVKSHVGLPQNSVRGSISALLDRRRAGECPQSEWVLASDLKLDRRYGLVRMSSPLDSLRGT